MIRGVISRGTRGGAVLTAALLALSLSHSAGAEPPGAPGAPGAPKAVDAAGLKQVLARQKGKVVILNFWATWCDPCRDEFPDIVRLATELGPGVTLVTVSLDDPEGGPAQVRDFLDKMKAVGVRLIKGAGDPDAFISSVDPAWSGALPATFVYKTDGARAHAIHGATDYAALSKLIAPLLTAAAPPAVKPPAVTPRTSARPPAPSGKP